MPLFVMIAHDGPDGIARRKQFRDQHVAHVRGLNDAGRIELAGPLKDDADGNSCGAVIVFTADSIDEARDVVHADPYVVGGVFESVTVTRFRKVFPSSP